MAEALLRARLAAVGIVATVSSAGLMFDDRGPEPAAIDALARLGIDISGHRSRILQPEMAAAADVVIGMENLHVREVAVLEGSHFTRTYTLPDLVSRAESVGPRPADEPLVAWIESLSVGGRSPVDLLNGNPAIEVPDPMGQSRRAFRRSAAEIDGLLARFVAMAFPRGAHDDDLHRGGADTNPATPHPTETWSS